MTDREPWERREDETDLAWMAFRIFRDLGLGRTVEEAWRKYSEKRDLAGGKAQSHFHNWKAEHDWYERVEAFDRRKEKQHQEQLLAARREALEEIAGSAGDLANALLAMAAGQLSDGEGTGQDRVQLDAIRESLDRIGVDTADELKVDAEVGVESNKSVEHSFDVGEMLQDLDADELDVAEKILDKLMLNE